MGFEDVFPDENKYDYRIFFAIPTSDGDFKRIFKIPQKDGSDLYKLIQGNIKTSITASDLQG